MLQERNEEEHELVWAGGDWQERRRGGGLRGLQGAFMGSPKLA